MQLVQDLRVATQELLDENNWVDEETKRLVAEKMEAMSVLAGFQEWISNVSTLDLFYDKVRVADAVFAVAMQLLSLYCTSNVLLFPAVYDWNVEKRISFAQLLIHKDGHFGNVARMYAFLQASNFAILDNKNYPNLK